MSFNFEPISKIIADRAKGAFVDVCAVINNVGSIDSITTRAGKQLEKRDLEIVDDSTKEKMRCTLWGQQAADVRYFIKRSDFKKYFSFRRHVAKLWL